MNAELNLSNEDKPFVIAIDGPAASGKGTLARKMAAALRLPHLDTGLTYRAVAAELLARKLPLDDENLAAKIAGSVDLAGLDRGRLADHQIGNAASKIAAMSRVRSALVAAQRAFANTPPGAVLDGRDIGTVVCPDADIKLFVTASAEVRARRRHQEMLANGKPATFDEILADLNVRDARDSTRKDSPLKPAEDALLLDTSKMDIEAAFLAAMKWTDKVLAAKNED